MTTSNNNSKRFYSGSINSINDFDDYLRAKGYIPFVLSEIPEDGYYAEIRRGSSNVKDFTQVGLLAATCRPISKLDLHPSSRDFAEKYEWVRIGYADCNNKNILNA